MAKSKSVPVSNYVANHLGTLSQVATLRTGRKGRKREREREWQVFRGLLEVRGGVGMAISLERVVRVRGGGCVVGWRRVVE